MKKLLSIALLAGVALSVTACSSDYVMSTKTGEMIVTHGKPEVDKDTGLTRYTDQQGIERQINNDQISQMIKKD
ncbi:YgdI/YgdR family lipoprotein [Enterobacteriaceae bacterium H11S18]|uniref:YgdI/YgdR family lipoprotein n=1 Tax=Enterobacteriaceae TaxID=543 RepID=UPI001925DE50|nr:MULTISPECIES: YgdI/YgdR family lipoprotein [Enterobacteriaceae]MCT4704765.1 YgdI/YgdR family lipoprotein [Dryocola clanedunensis]MCT4711916.1 YgdI/YgdR family lipoprotein [Dryocola clanedunensis]